MTYFNSTPRSFEYEHGPSDTAQSCCESQQPRALTHHTAWEAPGVVSLVKMQERNFLFPGNHSIHQRPRSQF